MKRINSISFITLTQIVMVLCAVLLVSCSEDKDPVDLCGLLKVQKTQSFDIVTITLPEGCSGEGGYTYHYDSNGKRISIGIDFSCGSSSYSGIVFNIEYASDGHIRSYDATLNGQNCHWEE